MADSISDELATIDLPDVRLKKRSKKLLETLAADPEASINAACGGWNETQAAYRFFKNPSVQPEAILEAHIEATRRRIEDHDCLLVVQDTTELDYTAHPPEDASTLNTPDRFGFYDHSHIVFTPEKLCLGVLGVELFNRDPETLGKPRERESIPIEEKESYRWLQGYRLCCQLAGEYDDKQIISVADCESDIYEIFVEHSEHPSPADFVIRAQAARSLPEKDPEAGAYTYKKVHDQVAQSKCLTKRNVDLPATPKRQARTASLEIRATEVTVKPPLGRGELPQVHYNIVLVEEVDGPGDGTDVRWLLITTLPIDTVEQVLRVVETYVARWPIEVFFRVYKSGCRVEEVQLERDDRVQRCLMLYKIIAWRVMYLTFLGRECPELSCEVMFAEAEWKPVWKITSDDPPPSEPPTLGEFIPRLAQLGGYNRRSSDRPPGPQTIWVGLRRMTDFALAWNTFGPGSNSEP